MREKRRGEGIRSLLPRPPVNPRCRRGDCDFPENKAWKRGKKKNVLPFFLSTKRGVTRAPFPFPSVRPTERKKRKEKQQEKRGRNFPSTFFCKGEITGKEIRVNLSCTSRYLGRTRGKKKAFGKRGKNERCHSLS